MPDPKLSDLASKVAEFQKQNAILEEKLRAIETSYVVDRRVVIIVGTGEDVRTRTGKSIDDRVKLVDASLASAQAKLDALQSSLSRVETLKSQVDGLAADTATAVKRSRETRTTRIVTGEGHVDELKYSELGYALPQGRKFECEENEWVTGLEVYSNREGRFAGLTVTCQSAWATVR